jgi:predicted DNA-binding transcriptional regulator YafY
MKSEAGYSAPIVAYKEGKKAYYRYEDKKYSINNSPLNQTEAEQLRNAVSILQRFEGAPQFEWINEIGPMLDSHFGLSDSRKIMSYDTNIDYSGYEYITQIFNAILNKRVLQIEYEPFNKPKFKLEFHPHYLKQFNNRWFVFGLNQKLGIEKWNLALDRIQLIDEIDRTYIESDIDWEAHFYDIIGVSMPTDGKLETVELVFSKEQANYVQTKPLHPSQRTNILETGELQVFIKVVPNYELEMRLLSFGEKVKVVKPEELKGKIINRLLAATEKY